MMGTCAMAGVEVKLQFACFPLASSRFQVSHADVLSYRMPRFGPGGIHLALCVIILCLQLLHIFALASGLTKGIADAHNVVTEYAKYGSKDAPRRRS